MWYWFFNTVKYNEDPPWYTDLFDIVYGAITVALTFLANHFISMNDVEQVLNYPITQLLVTLWGVYLSRADNLRKSVGGIEALGRKIVGLGCK